MAESTFTQTGVRELAQAIEAFPASVTAALKAVAQATAVRVQVRAKALLRAQQKTSATKLADNITIEEDAANKRMLVVSRSPVGQGTNVNLWNEYGTVKMSARPYMHPAATAEDARYRTDMEAAAGQVAGTTFGESS